MSMNLMFSNGTSASDLATTQWAGITKIADEGIVYIADETVRAIADLLDGANLSNGEVVTAYNFGPCESLVCDFGPGLLRAEDFRLLYTLLEKEDEKALAMLNHITESGLQIRFCGKDHIGARIVGVNASDDMVEFNRANGNMIHMIQQLGLGNCNDADAYHGETTLENFRAAVEKNGESTDWMPRLQAFIDCAQRYQATSVYWA